MAKGKKSSKKKAKKKARRKAPARKAAKKKAATKRRPATPKAPRSRPAESDTSGTQGFEPTDRRPGTGSGGPGATPDGSDGGASGTLLG
ncbi:MAG: hypothetical protein ABR559_06050 [Gemmatimonadota bacterium]